MMLMTRNESDYDIAIPFKNKEKEGVKFEQ